MMLERFLSTEEAGRALGDRAFVQAMLDVESALARAQARHGAVPEPAALAIAQACRAERFDLDALAAEGARAGSLAIPLARQLTAEVARAHPDAAAFVHLGATSQDILDTAQVLVARSALALIDRDLATLSARLLALAAVHRGVPVLGRTLLQPAAVVSLDAKIAHWVAPLVRGQARLHAAGAAALQLQLGGAAGTRAALGPQAREIAAEMGFLLALPSPATAWHTERDRLADLACQLALLVGSLGKIGRDIALMSQGEVGELAEATGDGRGGSSAMPHKRNPVGAMVALAAALRAPQRVAALLAAMPQAHERGLGDWQAELVEFSGLLATTHGAVQAVLQAVTGLQVDAARMGRNIEAQRGLVFAEALSMRLAGTLGKSAAHRLVEGWTRTVVAEDRFLRSVAEEALVSDAALAGVLDTAAMDTLFDARQVAAAASAQVVDALREATDHAASLAARAPWSAWLPRTEHTRPGERGAERPLSATTQETR